MVCLIVWKVVSRIRAVIYSCALTKGACPREASGGCMGDAKSSPMVLWGRALKIVSPKRLPLYPLSAQKDIFS